MGVRNYNYPMWFTKSQCHEILFSFFLKKSYTREQKGDAMGGFILKKGINITWASRRGGVEKTECKATLATIGEEATGLRSIA